MMPCICALTLAVLGAGPPIKPALTAFESKYYIVESNLPPERARYVAALMDATGEEYNRRFQGFRGVVRQKPKLRVFASREQYLAAFTDGAGVDKTAQAVRGIFQEGDGIVYTHDGKDIEPVLKHECFHQFAALAIGGRLPTWANEGLAEYFAESSFDEASGTLTLGAVPAWRARLLQAAKTEGRLLSIDQLLRMRRDQWNHRTAENEGAVQYSQAWALCHFLVHGEGGKYRELFDAFLRHLDKGLDADTAFKRVFGADTKPLQGKYEAYLAGLAPGGANPP